MEFRHGDRVEPLAVVGPSEGKRGTEVTFLPSTDDLHAWSSSTSRRWRSGCASSPS